MKRWTAIGLAAVVCGSLANAAWAQNAATAPGAGAPAAAGDARKVAFESNESLAGWTVKGDVAVDTAKAREGKGGSLKVGPGGSAVLKLRDADESGKVDLWVYDDGKTPADAKASRTGPRWGIMQGDGKALAVGILYAGYLGGNEGYTASAYAGGSWFSQLFWLGVNRDANWHQWTFDFDAEKGLRILHNGQAVDAGHFDGAKAGLKGFRSLAFWGDGGKGDEQTFWVADISVTLGGPVKAAAQPAASPSPPPIAVKPKPLDFWKPSDRKVTIYTKDKPPAAPKLEDLALQDSVSQYGMTWTFEKPARVGHFVTGDWYVVGPVTVKAISPKPLHGEEIDANELDRMDLEQKVENRLRNGFMLNPPPRMEMAYDSGMRNYFRPELIQKLPVEMKPGDSLVATISMPKDLILKSQLWQGIERGEGDSSPVRAAAVLTCVAEPQPLDAFRPAFCDRTAKTYLARDLKRDLLPRAKAAPSAPDVKLFVRFTERPWVATGFFGFEAPVENTPQYGRDISRVTGLDALLLCTDLKPEDKEPLLVGFVQVGIDLAGMLRGGHPGWEGFGGHGIGRKLPIVFAGLLLGDDELANVNKTFPKARFGEDEQTAYGDAWTGAKVVFAGHRAIDQLTGIARPGTGPYEHKQPKEWTGGDKMSESYRRCCTSAAWVNGALALRLMHAEKAWAHDAFFDYCDRWMFEDEKEALKVLRGVNVQVADWAEEGKTWEKFVDEMWAAHRQGPGMPPIDGWKQPHDDSYLKNAMEKAKSAK